MDVFGAILWHIFLGMLSFSIGAAIGVIVTSLYFNVRSLRARATEMFNRYWQVKEHLSPPP